MSRPGSVALALVAVVLGLLVVVQIRSQGAGTDLAGRSTQELTVLVSSLSQRNAQLRTEVASLDREVRDLQAAKSRGESSVDALRADLSKMRTWSGLDAVTGPGVRITVAGPIAGEGVMDLLNELRDSGAEAADIDQLRVVAKTVVAGPAGGISVENRALPDSFTIDAIGATDTLTGSLSRPGGIVAQLSATYPQATVTVTPMARVSLPASDLDLRPAHGTPRL